MEWLTRKITTTSAKKNWQHDVTPEQLQVTAKWAVCLRHYEQPIGRYCFKDASKVLESFVMYHYSEKQAL